MPIIPITIGKNGQRYKKKEIRCICDTCEKSFVKSMHSATLEMPFHYCSRECVNEGNKKGGKSDLKRRETSKERFGGIAPLVSKEVQEKKRKTCLERYGVEHSWENKEIWNKRNKTIKNKYGNSNYFKTDDFKEKRISSFVERYSVNNPMSVPTFRNKRKETNLERYGGEPLSNPKILAKVFQTNLKRYGYRLPCHTPEAQDKAYKSQYGMSKEEYHKILPMFHAYKLKVSKITKKQSIHELDGFDERSRDGKHLDHIYSIKQGFIDNITPEIIGDISNLRFIDAKENIRKNIKCDITSEELTRKINER